MMPLTFQCMFNTGTIIDQVVETMRLLPDVSILKLRYIIHQVTYIDSFYILYVCNYQQTISGSYILHGLCSDVRILANKGFFRECRQDETKLSMPNLFICY